MGIAEMKIVKNGSEFMRKEETSGTSTSGEEDEAVDDKA